MPNRPSRSLFGATIFLSAFLLFQIQPLIAKFILPWFGGVASVWTTCLVFFQAVLLAGYYYAHWLSRRGSRHAMLIHVGLLAISLAVLPVIPSERWKPTPGGGLVEEMLPLLGVTVGLPYFLLSSTSPLLQAWFSRSQGGAMPWRYFALSNLASMLGLLTYPVVVEPRWTSSQQAIGWSVGYGAFVLICGGLAWRCAGRPGEELREETTPATGVGTRILWVLLSGVASAFLIALTGHISLNLAAVPLLWIVPLSLYLLSFIVTFGAYRPWVRQLFLLLGPLGLLAIVLTLGGVFATWRIQSLIVLFCLAAFAIFTFLHGELAALKPAGREGTSFYLFIALGGAIGSLLAAIAAPLLLKTLQDLPIALGCVAVAGGVLLWKWAVNGSGEAPVRLHLGRLTAIVAPVAIIAELVISSPQNPNKIIRMTRNMYASLQIFESPESNVRYFGHGVILHGAQFPPGPDRLHPTQYFARNSGVGRAILTMSTPGKPLKVGIVGLGAGTLAAYGRAGDRYTFYEINPEVKRVAEEDFSFLRDSPAEIRHVIGDARLSMEREAAQEFDVLVLDAFSSDAIPVHLLTREAFQVYRKHLKPDSVIAVHVSNNFLNLAPVVLLAAFEMGKDARLIRYPGDPSREETTSEWMVMTSRLGFFDAPLLNGVGQLVDPVQGLATWTDGYSNLFQMLR